MKNMMIKIAMVLVIVLGLILLFYTTDDFDELEQPLKQESTKNQPLNGRLTEGVGTYIGQDIDDWTADYGYPERIYQGDNQYVHYIYKTAHAFYDVRVRDHQIGMIYASGIDSNIAPFKVNQRAAEIYQGTSIDTEPIVSSEDGEYHFELSEADLKTQLLIKYDQTYVQVYIDQLTGKVMAARFMTAPMLVQMQPYTVNLNGKPLARTINKDRSLYVQVNEQQSLVDIMNIMRDNFEMHALKWLESPVHLCHTESVEPSYDAAEMVNQYMNGIERRLLLNNHYDQIQTDTDGCYAVRYLNN